MLNDVQSFPLPLWPTPPEQDVSLQLPSSSLEDSVHPLWPPHSRHRAHAEHWRPCSKAFLEPRQCGDGAVEPGDLDTSFGS